MSAEERTFFDTNVLFYSLDLDAGEKHDRAVEVLEEAWKLGSGVVSTQVLSEWAVNLRRKLGLGWKRIAGLVEPYLSWDVVVIDPGDPLLAMRIADDHRLSYWDGLVVQAARKAGARLLLTEDMSHGMIIDGVEIHNPFIERRGP